ncbi:MAG: MMPL family transporter [Deltaproteobacteria bacterium]|nr:MMPL family transporter [Deltaproteobacteria bacterium]MBW2660727.1 MMPL family transporter [Deltaproteobacteria bacterium]
MHYIIYRFHKHILILTALLTFIAIALAAQLKLDLNFFSLLPSNNTEVHNFFEITEEIGVHSLLIALVEIPPGYDRTKSESFVDILAENFAGNQLIHDVEYKSEEKQMSSLFQTFIEHFPLFLRAEGLEKLTHILSDNGIHRQVVENKALLMTPFGIAAKELVYIDPLGLRKLLKENITVSTGKQPLRPYKGYYQTSKGETTYLLFIKPEKPPQDIAFSKKLMMEVRNLERISLSEFYGQFDDMPESIKISYTGGYTIAVSDEATTKKDIKVTLLTSFLSIMFLFGLSFRTWRVLFYVGVSLIISLLWTLGFASVAFHRLNILTCVFSCVLIGLGIDFALHIVNRYFGEDKVDLDISHRLQQTFREAGMGIVVGGITTAVAFYSIAISDFRGFKELGIVTGTGILFCLVVMSLVLPCLLVFFSDKKTLKRKITISGFGLMSLMKYLRKYPGVIIITSLIIVCLLAILGTKINFDDNLRNFRPADSETFRLQDKATRWLGGSMADTFLVAQGKSEEEVMEINTSIYEAIKELEDSGMIAGIKSISQYLLSPSQQRKNIKFIQQHPDDFDIKRIKKTFDTALEENGFEKLDLYDRYFESLSQVFSAEKLFFPSSLMEKEFGKIINLFVFQKGDNFKTITYIAPPKDLWSRSDTTLFKEMIIWKLEAKGIDRNSYILTGPNLLTGDLKKLIINNFESAMWLTFLCIITVLFIYYRSLKLLLLCICPLMISLATLTGIMVIFRLDFNFFNIIVLPMIVGIGIDDGIHLTNTFRQSGHLEIPKEMSRTGRAVVLTSLTTIAGFGSITLAHYPGLQSIGYVAVIGVSSCLIASIVVLPAIFTMIHRRKENSC